MTARKDVREIAGYVEKLLAATQPDSAVGRKLVAWIRAHETHFGFSFGEIASARAKSGAKKRTTADDKPLTQLAWKKLGRMVARCAAESEPGLFARNAAVLASALRLSELESALFGFVAMASYQGFLDALCEQISETRLWSPEELIGVVLSAHSSDVMAALSRGPLASMKLIDGIGDHPGRFGLFVPYRILDSIRPPISGLVEIERALMGSPVQSSLRFDDFDHVARERDFAVKLLRGAVARRLPGINILIYGSPGTGKTELAKTMAHEIGSVLYSVGESDDYGDEPSRNERLSALQLNDRLLKHRGGACLLFDEMEDLLQRGEAVSAGRRRIRRSGSKVFVNRILERNNVPVIWTANSLDDFDPAFLRRMSFAFEMKTPVKSIRSRLWKRAADQQSVALGDGMADALASRHRVSPSLAQSAMRSVAVAGANPEQLDFVVGQLARASEGLRAPRRPNDIPCDLELLNPDRDLAALEKKLGSGRRAVSFCFYGPPGTGKSAYARRLAERMGLEVLEKKGSDLLSKWLGETEERIAAAFEEAAADERFLIIDEAESLIWSRAGARHSWEVSMTNEFLTGIENHGFPIACTTNQLSHFDEAAMRRFTFKLKFDFLSPDQVEKAFRKFFGMPAPAEARMLSNLAPGDFAVVKKQLDFSDDVSHTSEHIASLLAAEVAVKSQSPQRIGF